MQPVHVSWVDSCDSTQRRILSELDSTAPQGFRALAAHHQTAGRGRTGSWLSRPNLDLTLSVLRRGPLPLGVLGNIQQRVGEALASVLNTLLGHTQPQVTWVAPNDLYVAGRKIGGVLIDSSSSPTAVAHVTVGCGINVNGTVDTLGGTEATTLQMVANETCDIAALAQHCAAAIATELTHYNP